MESLFLNYTWNDLSIEHHCNIRNGPGSGNRTGHCSGVQLDGSHIPAFFCNGGPRLSVSEFKLQSSMGWIGMAGFYACSCALTYWTISITQLHGKAKRFSIASPTNLTSLPADRRRCKHALDERSRRKIKRKFLNLITQNFVTVNTLQKKITERPKFANWSVWASVCWKVFSRASYRFANQAMFGSATSAGSGF